MIDNLVRDLQILWKADALTIQTDTRNLKTTLDALNQEVRQFKDTIAGFVHNPLSLATDKLFVPAALSVIRALRSKKN